MFEQNIMKLTFGIASLFYPIRLLDEILSYSSVLAPPQKNVLLVTVSVGRRTQRSNQARRTIYIIYIHLLL